MTRSDPVEQPGHRRAPAPSIDSFLETKLHPPPTRDNWISRDRLVEAMVRATRHPVTLVAAPAGYGKTTLVAQWVKRADRLPTAWVSLDSGDNDPDRFWTHVAAALERAGCVLPADEPSHVIGADNGPVPGALLPGLLNAVAAMPDDIALVLDDFHLIQQTACYEQVQFLVANLPRQAHLVIISRSDPGLRLGRLRASSDLAEIRAGDLSFTADEAADLLAHDDVHLSEEAVSQLIERTEGWPAGLYLAALSLAGRADPDAFVRGFSGGNRFVGDYLTEEVLSRQTDRVREFITTVSILDRFSASLCDHVVGITDSAAILDDLERSNLFLVPLDDERQWFRFQHLFAAVALSELEITRPEDMATLHARAASGSRSHGHVGEAVQHSLAAGNTEEAAGLVQANWLQYVDAGRDATVLTWLDSLGARAVRAGPAARVTSAWMAALVGDETALADHLAGLDELPDYGPLPDGTRSVESAVAMIQGLFGYCGPLEMMAYGQRAVELETDVRSPYYAIANVILGHATYVLGDSERAILPLRAAARSDHGPGVIRVLGLSLEAFVQAECGDMARSRERAELAMDIVNTRSLRASPQASLAFAALGQAQAAAGKVDDALETLELGLAIRRQTSSQGVWGSIHHLLITARVAAQAGRFPLARELLGELSVRMNRFSEGMEAMIARAGACSTSSAGRQPWRCSTSHSRVESSTCCGCCRVP